MSSETILVHDIIKEKDKRIEELEAALQFALAPEVAFSWDQLVVSQRIIEAIQKRAKTALREKGK